MRNENLYIGYNYEGKECLLQYYDSTHKIYKDLLTKEKYFEFELNNLIKYSEIIECQSLFKSKLIKSYEDDRNQIIRLNNIYLGSICQVTKIISKQYNGYNIFTYSISAQYNAIKIENNKLLLKNKYDQFIDLMNNAKYNDKYDIEVGDYIVPEKSLFLFNETLPVGEREKTMTKKKLLEKYVSTFANNSKK